MTSLTTIDNQRRLRQIELEEALLSGLTMEDVVGEALPPKNIPTVVSWDKPSKVAKRASQRCRFDWSGPCDQEIANPDTEWFCPEHLAFLKSGATYGEGAVLETDVAEAGPALPRQY